MRKRIAIYIAILLAGAVVSVQAQNYVCHGDAVTLVKPKLRGTVTWQQQLTGQDWSQVAGIQGDTLYLTPEASISYRLRVEEGECEMIYSDLIKLDVVFLPVLTLPDMDSVCINADAFVPGPGEPAGGKYFGEQILDGKFYPALANPGDNTYYYLYEDEPSGCKDSIMGTINVLPLPDPAIAGTDQLLVIEDSVMLDAGAIAIGEGKWTILSGSGGRIAHPDDPKSVLYRESGYDTFELEWRVSNPCQSYADTVRVQFAETSKNPCPGTPFMFDDDGNRYKTVQIGNQCWMAENLRVGKYVPSITTDRAHSDQTNNGIVEFYSWGNNTDSLVQYGGLYEWEEMMGYPDLNPEAKDICPEGWHVPTEAEWEELNDYFVDKNAGRMLMPDSAAGFNAYYSGDRHSFGSFVSKGSSGFFWTSTDYRYWGANLAYYYEIVACSDYLQHDRFGKLTGCSVRCLKDQD